MADSKMLIRHALKIGAIELTPDGRELKSGRISPYFFNSGLLRTGQDIALYTEAYIDALRPKLNLVQVLYGVPYKGIPLATAITVGLWQKMGLDKIAFATSRKEAKLHGEGGIHIGASLAGKGIAMIDDVVTSGGSGEEALKYVRTAGGFPTVFAIAFDRMEVAPNDTLSAVQAFEKTHTIPVVAASSLNDLIAVLSEDREKIKRGSETLDKILKYRSVYGAKYS